MDVCGAVRANCGEEVECLDAVNYIFEFLAVAGKEDGAGSRSVADPDNVALDIRRAICCCGKRLVIAAVAGGGIGNAVAVVACIVVSQCRLFHGSGGSRTYRVDGIPDTAL